jgi:hypothetical protein
MAYGTNRHKWIPYALWVGTLLASPAMATSMNEQTTPAAASDTQPAATQTEAATTPADSKPAVKKVVLIDNNINDNQLKQILAKGYRPEARGSETVYCRKETPVGTRFPTKTCKTSVAILDMEQRSKDAAANAQRTTGNRPLP